MSKNKSELKLNMKNKEYNKSVLVPYIKDCIHSGNNYLKHNSRLSTNNLDY